MSMDGNLLFLTLVLPFVSSLVAAFLPGNARRAESTLAGLVALTGFVLTASQYPAVAQGEVLRHSLPWLPQLGLEFTLRMDGLAWLFALLVTGIGGLVVLYARYYMSPRDPAPRFFSFLLGFMGAMLGIVLSGNLVQLVFFWELTSLFSFLLIGYWHHNSSARDGARMALTTTGIGGLCLLVGVILLGQVAGSLDLDVVLASREVLHEHPFYLPALVLVLLGALTKSAQFPFHYWLPRAMAAPTPVSAYLHSATLVKVGVFLLARLWPVLSGTEAWFWLVGTAGLITFVLGACYATFQQDLKGLLAYSTISHLGLITLLLGLDSQLAAVAAIFHMINHATFKASLFMGAGIIDHETGTRDIRRLSGLYRAMPLTAALAMVAAASMAGVPLLNGFLSKEMFFAETVTRHRSMVLDELLPWIAIVAAMFTVTYSIRFIRDVFFGPPATDLPSPPREPPRWMLVPAGLLVLICLVVGMVPESTVGPFLHLAVTAVLGESAPNYSLAVWHGLTLPMAMSLAALAGGVGLYGLLSGYLARGVDGPPWLQRINSQRVFDGVMVWLSWRLARPVLGLLISRRLQVQLRWMAVVALAAGLWPLWSRLLPELSLSGQRFEPVLALVWVVGMGAALMAAQQAKYHRLVALMLMGCAGLATCITFVWFSAPDLALTQLLVEVVTTVLILLGLRWLPRRIEYPRRHEPRLRTGLRRGGDLAIALGVGSGLALLTYAIMRLPPPASVSAEMVRRAAPEGGGTNVVNVILVDFRGFDTLGEITVLVIVALGSYALLRRFRPAPESVDRPPQQSFQQQRERQPEGGESAALVDVLMVPALLMRLLFPVIFALGAYLFLRGHDLPGGGFVGGLSLAIALILQYMAGGTRWVEARLRARPLRWMGLGLLLAVTTGSGAMLLGQPFLTSWFDQPVLPVLGELSLATATLFDLGVLAVVVGATSLILIALAHQSIRVHRPAAPSAAAGPREKER